MQTSPQPPAGPADELGTGEGAPSAPASSPSTIPHPVSDAMQPTALPPNEIPPSAIQPLPSAPEPIQAQSNTVPSNPIPTTTMPLHSNQSQPTPVQSNSMQTNAIPHKDDSISPPAVENPPMVNGFPNPIAGLPPMESFMANLPRVGAPNGAPIGVVWCPLLLASVTPRTFRHLLLSSSQLQLLFLAPCRCSFRAM